jgi:50S ribosomal subunit-associated GTPase HflX
VDLGITGTPIIRVYNKIDALRLEPEEMNSFERSHRARLPLSVFISVKTGAGLDELRGMVREEAREIFS